MEKKKKQHVALVVAGLGVLGIAGYLLYKHEHPAVATSTTPSVPSGGGGNTNSLPSGNPTVDTGDQAITQTNDAAAGSDSADPGAVYTNG
jgi:hypothetical protein